MFPDALADEWRPGWSPVGRRERLVVLAVVLLALGLRLWHWDTIGIDHFDEGVYAFSGLGLSDASQPLRLYPAQIRFAPPVYISLVALSYLAGGPSPQAAILVNVILGTLTVLLLWAVGRRWFGPAAGIAAAVTLAASEHHILLSRTALTDVGFSFFFLAGLGLALEALSREQIRWAIAAGLVIGLAWNTKYHGWFALVVTGGALVPILFFRWRGGRPLGPLLRTWGVMAVVAALCYVPWALFINAQAGGYAALARYQRTMIDGTWPGNLRWQVEMMQFLDGPWTRVSIPLAIAAAGLLGAGTVPLALLATLSLGAAVVGGQAVAILVTLAALPLALLRGRGLPAWTLAAWVGLWLVSAPIYHPYFRLLLPLHIAAALGFGLLLSLTGKETQAGGGAVPALSPWLAVVVVAAIAAWRPAPGNPWHPRNTFETAVRQMAAAVPAGERVVVFGEPAAGFYLQLEGRKAFERVEDPAMIADLPTPVYVLVGRYGRAAPKIKQGLAALGQRLEPVGTWPTDPSDLRLLDDSRIPRAIRYRAAPDSVYNLTLFRLAPRTAGAPVE